MTPHEQVACNLCGDIAGAPIATDVGDATRRIDTPAGAFTFDVRLVCCATCGLVYWTPRMTADALRRYYEAVHRAPVGPTELDAARRQTIQSRLALLQGMAPPGRLLEIGCGEGFFLRSAADAGFAPTGIEPSDAYRDAAREIAPHALVVGGALEDFHTDRTFDAVCSFFVLEHVDDATAFLRRCRELLSPGGVLFLEVPDVSRYPEQTGDMLWHEHTYHFTPGVLRRLLAKAGFDVTTIASPGPSYGFGMAVLATAADAGSDRWRDGLPDGSAVSVATRAFAQHRDTVAAYRGGLHDVMAPVLARVRTDGVRLALYGCGVFHDALFRYAGLRASDVSLVVDDNDRRWGTRTSHGLAVERPDALVARRPDVVVIASDAFEASIATRLESLFGGSFAPLVLRPHSEGLGRLRGAATHA